MTQVLAIENVIRISLSGLPSGLALTNVNSLAIFTTERPSNTDPYNIYLDAQSVANDFGTSSETAAMAEEVFAQDVNILSGGGRLVILPLLNNPAVATSGKITTPDISANVTGLIAITNGSLTVTVNGVPHALSSINLTSVTTLAGIAAIFDGLLTDCDVTATATQLIFTSKTNGSTSTVALSGGGGGTDLYGNSYLKGATAVAVAGINAGNATSGAFTTANISANVNAIKIVANGDLTATINGVDVDVTGLDFTACTTLAHIAAVLQLSFTDLIITSTATAIIATSKTVGTTSDVILKALSGGTGTDMAGASYFNTAAGSHVAGINSTGETLVAAVARTEGLVDYVGVMTNLEMEDATVLTTALAMQSRDKLYLQHFASESAIAGICTTIKAAGYSHTRCLVYTGSKADANLMKCAYAGRAFSTNFTGSNTCATMNLKPLVGVVADPNLGQTEWSAAALAGCDIYVSYQGVESVVSNGTNLYFDDIYGRLAMKFALQVAGFNYLRQTNTKAPQTEKGMDGLKDAYKTVYEQFVTNGYIGVGLTWNSSQTFGDPATFKRNITNKGYYQYSLPIAQQSQAGRAARTAPLVQGAIKQAGAIHSSDVIVTVEQ